MRNNLIWVTVITVILVIGAFLEQYRTPSLPYVPESCIEAPGGQVWVCQATPVAKK